MINPFKFFRVFFSLLASAIYVIAVVMLLFFILSLLLIWFERENHGFWDMLYLSAITALTVGYGDYAPTSVGGRLASIGLALVGVLFVGIVVAAAVKSLESASES